jgi:hypothetical protein
MISKSGEPRDVCESARRPNKFYYHYEFLIAIFCGIIFGRYHQTSTFSRASVYCLDNINHLLLILQCPVYFIVVASAQIDHDVLISEEEHDCARIVQLVPAEDDDD